MKYKAKMVDKATWIIQSDNELSLLTNYNGTYTLTSDGKSRRYNRDQLSALFKEDILRDAQKGTKKETCYYVGGFKINKIKPAEVSIHDGRVIFKKNKYGDVSYCAGYYGVKFHATFVPLYCPKESTVNKYEHLGPYKSMEELKAAIHSHNK